jgi:PEGA domain
MGFLMSSHTEGRRSAWPGILVIVCVLAAVVVLAVFFNRPPQSERLSEYPAPTQREVKSKPPEPIMVRIVSVPAGASVFDEKAFLGAAPVEIILGADDVRHLRLLRINCTEGEMTIRGKDYAAGGAKAKLVKIADGRKTVEEAITLATAMKGSLSVVCAPADAEVFLDGQRLGAAPVWKDGLSVGTYLLRAEKKDHTAFEKKIEIKAGEEALVKCVLESRWGALYRKKIAENRALMTNYSEMAHHFTIFGDFKKAEEAVWAGVEIMRKKKQGELAGSEVNDYSKTIRRFTIEISHIYTDYFAYPREGSDATIRAACIKAMEAIDDEDLAGSTGKKYLRTMRNYQRRPEVQ